MFKNLKHLELTRHHIQSKIKHSISELSKKENTEFHNLSEVVFSSALSLYLTYLTEMYFSGDNVESPNLKNIFLAFIGGLILYCVLYVVIKKLYSLISQKFTQLKHNITIKVPDISPGKTKEILDDFDHIAFDNLIVAYELLDEIEHSTSIEIRTFCFHEVIYYLKTSIQKTKEVIHPDRRDQCLNIFCNTDGIDVFRLYNLQKTMCSIYTKIESLLTTNYNSNGEKTIELYDEDLEFVLMYQINEIKCDIDRIGIECENAKNDLKPKL